MSIQSIRGLLPHRRPPYFHGRIETAHTKHGDFAPEDKVKILPSHPAFPVQRGEILRLVRGNHGKGRVHAVIKLSDGREQSFPIGACRHEKRNPI